MHHHLCVLRLLIKEEVGREPWTEISNSYAPNFDRIDLSVWLTISFLQPPSPPTENAPPPGSKLKSVTDESGMTHASVVAPSAEIPPPPPNSKERKMVSVDERYIEDVGETEEISLN